MKHSTSQFLYTYWNEIRDGRMAPKRFEIEPARIGAVLPDAFILERADDGQFIFRLVGTRIGDRYQRELRHVGFDVDWSEGDRETINQAIFDVTERGAVAVFDVTVIDDTEQSATLEVLLLPLIHTQNRIDRILGTISLISDTPWVGVRPIVRQHIAARKLIWPDGRPYQFLQQPYEPMVLEPQLRKARIVTANRRQFRVYDGGRTDAGDDGLL